MPVDNIVFVPGLSYGPSLFDFQTTHLADAAACHVVQVSERSIDAFVDGTLSAAEGEFALVAHSGATLARSRWRPEHRSGWAI
jgi:hypothetical protein